MTEYCNYKRRSCIRLSDTAISVITTNISLSRQSYSLDSSCKPRYLQRLGQKKFAVVCKGASFQVFHHVSEPQLENIVHGEDGALEGILVQSGIFLFHVEVDPYHLDLILYNVRGGSVFDYVLPDSECTHSLSLHLTFSRGTFFYSCLTDADERLYFLYRLADDVSVPIRICNDPVSSEGSTYAVACNDALTIYMKSNIEESHSKNFTSPIKFFKFLDRTTLIVALETGSEHIVNVQTFMNTNGTDGVYTLHDASDCTPSKLITPRVYATVCTSGALYSVHLYNTTNGEVSMSVANLTERPLGLYYVFGPPIPTSPATPPTSELTTSTNSTDMTTNQHPSTSESGTGESTKTQDIVLAVGIVLRVLALGVLLLLFALVICYYCWKSRQRLKQLLHSGTATPSSADSSSLDKVSYTTA